MGSEQDPATDLATSARGASQYGSSGRGRNPVTFDMSTARPHESHAAAASTPRSGHSSDDGGDITIQRSRSTRSDVEDPDLCTHEDVEETTFSGAMATIIKDTHRLSKGSKHPGSRITRIVFALFMAVLLIAVQMYVLFTIKKFVVSGAVRSIRQAYSEYQETMYHGHVKDSGYGFSLGIGGPKGPFFDPNQFAKVSDGLKGSVCIIPFSQPGYLFIILFIWCLSVVGELRQVLTMATWLWAVPHKASLQDMVGETQEDGREHIVGMPRYMKVGVSAIVLVPRFLTAVILLWLGCRWLTATLDFTEVLINAIALEFVITLNSAFYHHLVSDRSKRENRSLKFDMQHQHRSPPGAFAFVGTIAWGIGAASWVYLYMNYLQMVIPGYQWDVRGPCKPWVAERFNFWRI